MKIHAKKTNVNQIISCRDSSVSRGAYENLVRSSRSNVELHNRVRSQVVPWRLYLPLCSHSLMTNYPSSRAYPVHVSFARATGELHKESFRTETNALPTQSNHFESTFLLPSSSRQRHLEQSKWTEQFVQCSDEIHANLVHPSSRGFSIPVIRGDNIATTVPVVRGDNIATTVPVVRGDNIATTVPVVRGDNIATPVPVVRGDNIATTDSDVFNHSISSSACGRNPHSVSILIQ